MYSAALRPTVAMLCSVCVFRTSAFSPESTGVMFSVADLTSTVCVVKPTCRLASTLRFSALLRTIPFWENF